MKTTCLLFTLIGCAVLMRGVSHADPSSPASAPPSAGASVNPAGDPARDRKHPPPADDGKPPTGGKALHGNQHNCRAAGNSNQNGSTIGTRRVSQQAPNRQEHSGKTQVNGYSAKSPLADAAGFRKPLSTQSLEPAKAASARNKTDHLRSLTVRPPSVIQPAGPLFKDARNRGPATAVIGGPGNLKHRMTAEINGATMSRKP